MEVTTQFIDPVKLTGMMREAQFDAEENEFRLSSILPTITLQDIDAKWTEGQQGLAEATTYRAFNAETPIARRESLGRRTLNLPPIGQKIPLDEYHSMRLRNLDGDMAGVLEPYIARDAQRLARNIVARFEIARGDALFNGRVTIEENGLVQEIDFGRSAEANVAVDADKRWSLPETALPISDLIRADRNFRTLNGVKAEAIWMPREQYLQMVQTAQVRNQVLGVQYAPDANSGLLIDEARANNALGAFGLPPIRTYDATTRVTGENGKPVPVRITPDNKLLFVAPGQINVAEGSELGATFLGVTAEASLPEYGISAADQPGIVAAQWYSKDPVTYWTHSAALGVPILRNANLAYVLQVDE